MTREELEAAKAAALAKVAAEYDAKIAALDEQEPDALALEEAENWLRKHNPRNGYMTLAAWIPRALAKYIMLTRPAAPLMPTAATAMTDAEIEELAEQVVGDWRGYTNANLAKHTIRATIARLGPVRGWPSEAELRKMVQSAAYPPGRDRGPCEAALEMARRLRERVQ